jgi:hypothetical protein
MGAAAALGMALAEPVHAQTPAPFATPIEDDEFTASDAASPGVETAIFSPVSVVTPQPQLPQAQVSPEPSTESAFPPPAQEFSAILGWLDGMAPLVQRFNAILAAFEGGGLVSGDRAAVLAQLDRLAAQGRRAQPEIFALRAEALALPPPPAVAFNAQLEQPLNQVVPGFVRQLDALYVNTEAVIAAPAAIRAGDRIAFESAMSAVLGSGRLVLETERDRLAIIDAAFAQGRPSVEASVIEGLIAIVRLPELVLAGRWPQERSATLAAISRSADEIELAARDYRTGREAIAPLLGVAPYAIPPVLESQLNRFRLLTEPTAEQRAAEVEIANALRGVHDRLARAASPDQISNAASDPLLRATIARRDQIVAATYRGR